MISPVNRGKQSVVKHMLAIDWKFWKSYLLPSSAKSITIQMLGRVAGIVFHFFFEILTVHLHLYLDMPSLFSNLK